MQARPARSLRALVPSCPVRAAATASTRGVRRRRMRAAAAAAAAAATWRGEASSRHALRRASADGSRAAPCACTAAPAQAGADGAPYDAYSEDVVSGQLRLRQGAGRGAYRFGLDALLLATDLPGAATRAGAQIVELGAANGVVALCVATRFPECQVVAVERQASLLALLEHNAARAGLAPPRFAALAADVRATSALPQGTAALVLANPPFFPPQPSMRLPGGGSERAAARHELHGGIGAFVTAARAALAPRGLLKLVLPPQRLRDMMASLDAEGLTLRSLRFVHAAPGEGAHLFEAIAGAGGATGGFAVPAPLFVRGTDGRYTVEAARRIAGAALPPDVALTEEAVAAVRATCRRYDDDTAGVATHQVS